MEHPHAVLANIDNFGKIYRCGNCDHMHLQVGPVVLLLTVEAYMQLVDLVNTSASNFEASMEWTGADEHDRLG